MNADEGDGEDLISCSAALLYLEDVERWRFATRICVAGFVGSTSMSVYVMALGGGTGVNSPCFCLFLAMSLFFGWFAMRRLVKPGFRGRLRLFEEELVFKLYWSTPPAVHLPLPEIERLGRNQNMIQIRLRGESTFYFFDCSRLHGEDMYDQITTQLDEFGVEGASHDSDHLRRPGLRHRHDTGRE